MPRRWIAGGELPEVWVLELSSFQLDAVRDFEPSAAAVLNITQDHLDWHGSMDAYAAAKARIFGRDAVLVLNRDDAQVEAGSRRCSRRRDQGRRQGREGGARPCRGTSCASASTRRAAPGDFGLVTENGMAWLVRAHEPDEAPRKRRGDAPADAEELHLQRLMPADALRIRGRHNAANALAALALASAIGCALAPMLHGLREYRGEPHRVEHVASVQRHRLLRRQQGHQRRRHRRRARWPRRRPRAGQARADARRRRQGPGLHAAGGSRWRAMRAPSR